MATATTVIEPNVKISATKLLINGQWVNSASGKTFPTINPSTGEVITQVAEADAPDVDKAVSAARAAFETGPWRKKLTASQRGNLMYKLADLMEKNADELAQLGPRQRQALSRRPRRRRAAHHRLLSLLRRLGRQKSGQDHSRKRPVFHLHQARTSWRCRPDYPVEFPASDASLETWSRASCGLHRRSQALGADAAQRFASWRTDS